MRIQSKLDAEVQPLHLWFHQIYQIAKQKPQEKETAALQANWFLGLGSSICGGRWLPLHSGPDGEIRWNELITNKIYDKRICSSKQFLVRLNQ